MRAASDMRAASSNRLLVGSGLAAIIVVAAAVWTIAPVKESGDPKSIEIVLRGDTPVPSRSAARSLQPLTKPVAVRSVPSLDDPLLDGLIGDDGYMSPAISHSGLHATLRKERRDEDWAPRAEGALLANIARVPYLDRNVLPRVTCGATWCEVVVTLSSAATIDQSNQTLDILQSDTLSASRRGEAQLDSDYHSVAVGPTSRNKRGTVFVRYIPRLT